MPTGSTDVSRLVLSHPDLDHDGGSGLHTKIHALWKKVGDALSSRYFEAPTLANAGTTAFVHNYKCPFADLSLFLYALNTGSGELTRLDETTSPKRSEFSAVATSGSETTSITVTNNSGSTQAIAAIVLHDGGEGQKSFSIANNQASPASLSGLLFSSALHKGVQIPFDLRRSTNSTALDESGVIHLSYSPSLSAWRVAVESLLDNAGVSFSITAGGQLQYTSTSISGTGYAGTLRIGKMRFINQ
jgi:hypothetical protein